MSVPQDVKYLLGPCLITAKKMCLACDIETANQKRSAAPLDLLSLRLRVALLSAYTNDQNLQLVVTLHPNCTAMTARLYGTCLEPARTAPIEQCCNISMNNGCAPGTTALPARMGCVCSDPCWKGQRAAGNPYCSSSCHCCPCTCASHDAARAPLRSCAMACSAFTSIETMCLGTKHPQDRYYESSTPMLQHAGHRHRVHLHTCS